MDKEKLEQAKELLKELNDIRRKMNKEPIKLTDAESIKQLKSLPGDIDDARAALARMEETATSLYAELQNITKEIVKQSTPQQKLARGFKSLANDAEKLKFDEQEISRLSQKELQNLQKRVKQNKARIKAATEEMDAFKSIESKVDEILSTEEAKNLSAQERNDLVGDYLNSLQGLKDAERAALALYFDQENVIDRLVEKTAERLKLENKIEQDAAGFTVMSDIVKSIPGLSGLSGPFEKAANAAKEASREGKGSLGAFAAGGKALMKAFGPLTLIITAIKTFKDIAFGVDQKVTDIAKNMGLGEAAAEDQYQQFKQIKNESDKTFITTKKLIAAQAELSSTMGAVAGMSNRSLENHIEMTKVMGIEADTAGKLQRLALASNEESDQSLSNILDSVAALDKETGIRLNTKGVIDEVAKTEGELALQYKNNPGLIARAVTQVRKLGLSLSQAGKMSESLLDFETSISKEMEAEVLLGKDLNLDRARALALQGDSAGAAAEIMKQVKAIGGLEKMNVIERKALAEAAGMSADELANAVMQEENLQKLGKQARKQLEDRVARLKAQGKVEEANRLLTAAGNKEDLEAALKRQSLNDQFNDAMDRIKESFAEVLDKNIDIRGTVESIVGFFANLSKNLGAIKAIAMVLVGAFAAMAISSTISAVAAMTTASAVTFGLGALAIGAGLIYLTSTMDNAIDSASSKTESKTAKGTAADFISRPGQPIQKFRADDIIIGGTSPFGSGNNDEGTRKLLEKNRSLNTCS